MPWSRRSTLQSNGTFYGMPSIGHLIRAARKTAGNAGISIAHIGERRGIHALTYNPVILYRYDKLARESAPGFAARIVATFGPLRYLDVGAGTGRLAEALRELGSSADACEYSRWGRMLAARRGLQVERFDLSKAQPGPSSASYDIAVCLEVAEHVSADVGDRLVEYLATFPVIVFTAAPPGQRGVGHINEQPQSYWDTRFKTFGRRRQHQLERRVVSAQGPVPGTWLLENLMIYAE
jgi:SAM-dependent methyltransferase